MAPTPKKTLYELWQDTIDTAKNNPKWNVYDKIIKETVATYNSHLSPKNSVRLADVA